MAISSSLAGQNNRWHLRLLRHFSDANRVEEFLTAVTDKGGNWNGVVVPGQYILQVSREDQSIWHSTTVVVEDSDVHFNVHIPVTVVIGRVKLGETPVSNAKLVFGGIYGAEQIPFVTDRDGEFRGEIPTKDTDGPLKWKISIESSDPAVRRTAEYLATRNADGALRFDIDLPRTIVRGRVVDENGNPDAMAIVSLRSPDNDVFEQANTDADGRFELYGFEPGVYRIQAEAFQRSSEITNVQATDAEVSEIEIVLRKNVLVTGKVQSRSTAGVSASLIALQREVRTMFVPSTSTDSGGLFTLTLPPGTRIFDLVVNAPGFALATGRVAIREGKALTLTVDQVGGALSLLLPRGLEATIRRPDGAEFSARSLATLVGGAIQDLDGTDSISFPSVEPGAYEVCVGATCRRGVVAPGGALELEVPARVSQNAN